MTGEKVLTPSQIEEKIRELRESGLRIVQCHGVFDLLHPGHLRHLAAAKEMGDILIVSITADEFVNKGPGRPAFAQDIRAEAIAALESVDYVTIARNATAIPIINVVRPDFYVKGSDYSEPDDDVTGQINAEQNAVERNGGKIAFTDDIVFSSSQLINSFLPSRSETVRAWLTTVRDQFHVSEILSWLDAIQSLSVTVVGEAIIDVYTQSEVLGVASKEPVLCLNRGVSEVHLGGSLAVARHCAGLGASVDLIAAMNSADRQNVDLAPLSQIGINLCLIDSDPRPTIRKERVIDSRTSARLLELYEMDDSPWLNNEASSLIHQITESSQSTDLTIVVDYGHGLLADEHTASAISTANFLALNAQTNAGNHGFNSVRRYPRADFVALNGREAQLEARRRHVDLTEYMPTILRDLRSQAALLTRGDQGLELFLADGSVDRSPALAPFVADRVGAGDAVLSVTSMLLRLGAPPSLVGFVGSVVGAWAVSFVGNEQVLNLGHLKKQVISILK